MVNDGKDWKKAAQDAWKVWESPDGDGDDYKEAAREFAQEFRRPPPLAQILDDIHEFLGRFVIYPSKEAHDAHVLWIAHTHCMDAWESTPRIAFLSPCKW